MKINRPIFHILYNVQFPPNYFPIFPATRIKTHAPLSTICGRGWDKVGQRITRVTHRKMIPEGNHPEEEGGGGQRGKERSSHRRKLRRVRCLIRAYWTFLWNKIWPDVGGGPAQVKKYLWERREGPSNPSSPSSWFSCGRLARLVISSLNQSCRGPKGIIFIGKPIPRRSVKGLQLVYTGYLARLDHFLPGRFFNDRSCIVHETSLVLSYWCTP